MSEETSVIARGTFRRRSRLFARKLILVGVFACVMALGVRLTVGQDSSRASVAPGEVAWITVEVPMKRSGGDRRVAEESGLLVLCSISALQGGGGVRVAVVETGRRERLLWAKLRVEASSWASPGPRTAVASFTVNGEGGWPTSKVVIDVEP